MLDCWCQNQEDNIMTIEIADRLVKLRKQHGYSQEELADKLGLSRQAVSKWERAEASPDTDNLICLAKLYGVSLDQLLSTDDDVETIVNEQVKDKQENVKDEEETTDEVKEEQPKAKQAEGVEINNEGIFIHDKNGERVVINSKGIHCFDKDSNEVERHKHEHHHSRALSIISSAEGVLFLCAVVAYLLMGFLAHMWYNGWVVFFLPEIICSIARAIVKKNAQKFNIFFASTFAFFFVCMVAPGLSAKLWHPMWVVFLAIPIYHGAVSVIHKIVRHNKGDEKVVGIIDEDNDNEEDDD